MFEGNHPNVFEKTKQCMVLAARTQSEVVIDGKKCSESRDVSIFLARPTLRPTLRYSQLYLFSA